MIKESRGSSSKAQNCIHIGLHSKAIRTQLYLKLSGRDIKNHNVLQIQQISSTHGSTTVHGVTFNYPKVQHVSRLVEDNIMVSKLFDVSLKETVSHILTVHVTLRTERPFYLVFLTIPILFTFRQLTELVLNNYANDLI